MPRGGRRTGSGRKRGSTGPQEHTKVLRQKIRQHHELTAARTLEELRRLAFSDIGDLFDANGRLRPLKDIPPTLRACIASVKTTKKNLTAGDGIQEDVVEVRLWDKIRAIEMAAKHHGLLTEKLDVTGAVTFIDKIARARQRIAS